MTDALQLPLTLKIQTREGIIYEGSIASLTGVNQKGTFDILPLHSNFISLVEQKIKIKDVDGSIKEIEVQSGIMRVVENTVEIYLGFLDQSTSQASNAIPT